MQTANFKYVHKMPAMQSALNEYSYLLYLYRGILKVNCSGKKFFAHMKAYWS